MVQTTYSERMRPALPGMVANMADWDGHTRAVETADGIGFGLAVSQGAADKGVILGGTASGFVGITMRDPTVEATPARPDYDTHHEGDEAGILTRGTIWVQVGGDVTAGESVYFNGTTGVLSATSGGNQQIARARWDTSAVSGGVAVVRLNMP